MLCNLKIQNFRSIKDRTEISFEPTLLREHSQNIFKPNSTKRLLKTTVFYGSNASGKSNVILSLKAIEYLVYNSMDFKPGKDIEPYEPFRCCPDASKAPVYLEIEFFASNKKRYTYAFEFNKNEFLREELFTYPNNRKTLLFSRVGEDIKFGDSYKGGQKEIFRLTGKNQLFLSKAAINNVESVLPVFQFIESKMHIVTIKNFEREKGATLYAERLASGENSTFAKKFNALLRALDTGIKKVVSKEVDWDKKELPSSFSDEMIESIKEQNKYDIKTFHGVYKDGLEVDNAVFDWLDESEGTQALMFLCGVIIDKFEEGGVLVVDEFEKNLHPNLTAYLIDLFHNKDINSKNAQLIFATHDITQLSQDRFRRDQVYFTEKTEFGETEIFRASEIKGLRYTTPIDKWYVNGKLGATPIIDDLEFLIAMGGENE